MSTLVVLAFPTETGAQEVLAVINDLQRQHLITLDDAATVVHGHDGKPRVKQATTLVDGGASGGAFGGTPFFGFLFFMPFLATAIGAIADALAGKFTEVGIDHRFIRDVQQKIKPGQSGLFLLVREVQLDHVLPAVEPYHPEVLQSSLSKEQEARLREALGGAPAEAVVAATAVMEAEPEPPRSTAVVEAEAPQSSAVVETEVPQSTAVVEADASQSSAAVETEALAALESGFRYLFDNTPDTFEHWRFVGEGTFAVVDGALEAQPGPDWGVLYYAAETFGDFDLRLDFRLDRIDSDSGVFLRFRDPLKPVPDRDNPASAYDYDRQQWVAVNTGFEVQIDELARGSDGERDEHRTGALYDIPVGTGLGQQQYDRQSALTPGTWHQLEIVVRDNTYGVNLDGRRTTTYTNTDLYRGLPPGPEAPSGYIGLQAYLGQVAFRSVRIRAA
jgi:uncharacterized membrane protein